MLRYWYWFSDWFGDFLRSEDGWPGLLGELSALALFGYMIYKLGFGWDAGYVPGDQP